MNNIKLVILAGGYGTRISEETNLKPKPMIEIGGKPIIWHIMKIYSYYGFNDFIIALGVKGHVIKEYFYNFESRNNDFTADLSTGEIVYHNKHNESDWKVTLVDTGEKTMTGGRLKRIEQYVASEDMFCFT